MIPVLAHATVSDNLFDGISQGALLIRVVVGVTLAAHGYYKFFLGGKIAGTARWFQSMGMKPNGTIHAYLAACTESGAGILFALGFLTPLAAAGFVGLMVVAAWTTNRPNGFYSANHGWEYNLVLAVVPVGIAMIGPGRYSLDWQLGINLSFRPLAAFTIAAVVGILSGLALILCCYRPPAPEPEKSEA
jgi:putative oxidoreductase